MLTVAQKQHFVDEGYVQIPGAIPTAMIEAARRAVNHSIGEVGMGGENAEGNRSGFFCAELLDAPVITDLYNRTPVIAMAESLMGEGNVQPVERAKPYPRFPLPPGEDPPEPRGHLDGIGNGSNGTAKGDYKRGFTAFAVIYLADVPEPYSGNFTVWPTSHRIFADYFKREGHEVLKNGMPRPELPEPPVMITGKAGDLVFAHHQMMHGACANASPNVRLAVITRLKHKDVEVVGNDAYTDIWREWAGVRDLAEAAS
jgi:hypothetical protein